MNLSLEASILFAPPSTALKRAKTETATEVGNHGETSTLNNDLFDFTNLPFTRVTILSTGETVPYNPFESPSHPVNLSWQDNPKSSTPSPLEPEIPITTQLSTIPDTPLIVYTEPNPPKDKAKIDFYTIYNQYIQTTNTKDKHSYTISDSFSKEEINQWGEPFIKCHLWEKIIQIQEAYSDSEITSIKSKSRDKKNNRIGLSLNTKNGWIRITSDGEKIFITKSNNYYRVLNPTLLGIEATQEKLEKILSNDTNRLFAGE